MNVKTILEEQFKDLISEETLSTIEEAFQSAVSEKVDEKLKVETESFTEKLELEKENIKQNLDEQYSEKLQLVIELQQIDFFCGVTACLLTSSSLGLSLQTYTLSIIYRQI